MRGGGAQDTFILQDRDEFSGGYLFIADDFDMACSHFNAFHPLICFYQGIALFRQSENLVRLHATAIFLTPTHLPLVCINLQIT